MNDDRLSRHLRRRADSADVPPLLSSVRYAIETRPQAAPAHRWAPLAGLAVVGMILMVLVVVVPRSQLTGANVTQSPSSTSTPPSTFATGPTLHDCGSIANYYQTSVFAVDESGAIDSCTAGARQGWSAGDAKVVVQAMGDAGDQIEVAWRRSELCNPERILIEIRPSGIGYALRLIFDRSGPYGYECGDYAIPEHALLSMSKPIDPAGVSVDLKQVPDLDPLRSDLRDLQQSFQCAGGAAERVPTIMDLTGVVTGCRQLESGSPSEGSVDLTNQNGFDSVRFDWIDTTCDGPVEAEFQGAAGGYNLAVKQPANACSDGRPVAVVVDYRIPMPVALVTAGYVSPPPVFDCIATDHVSVVDEVGVVTSCAASQSTVSPGTELVAVNPDGDTNALQISWTGASCIYDVHLQQVDVNPTRYAINVYNTSDSCPLLDLVHTVTLQLTTPISANDITGWSIGGPPRTAPPSSE